MNKFMNWLADSFAPKATELFGNPWISAVSSTMQKVLPFILTGSCVYLYNVIKLVVPGLPDLSPIANYSFGLTGLFVAFFVANQAMEKLNHPLYVINAGLASVGTLFIVTCPVDRTVEGGLGTLMSAIGPAGIMLAIFVGLFVSLVFHLWGKLHLFEDSDVPDFVAGWINTIVPILICLGVGMAIMYGFGINLNSAIVAVFLPISDFAQTLPGFILICFVPAFFYTMGVSSWTFNAITTPVFLPAIQANIDAVAAGGVATNIVTHEAIFALGLITMGGRCATLALNLLMLRSKSSKLKALGKVFLVPSIFNINEPIMYSSVVFNPLLMIPAWINSIIGPVYVWVLMTTGLLNIPAKLLQVGQLPAPLGTVLVTDDFRGIIWWAILLVIYFIVWLPFYKTWEKEQVALEAEQDDEA